MWGISVCVNLKGRLGRLGLCNRVVPNLHAQYDWTTGVLDNGNEWRKFRAVPRLYALRSLVCTLFNKVEAEGLLDYQGRAGIISVVRWNLRPVIFGVENSPEFR